jgi:hypothetical protein
MSPYRHPPEPRAAPSSSTKGDDVVLGAMLLAVGGLRVILAIVGGEAWGAEASIAAILLLLGVLLLLPRLR